ncbi:MAG: hypothetical protein LQ337_006020 [Flavoplaca oasis]|nr:MAG: hypothetical protein LQ337_006020 [Flavoplaca oasis]
MAASNTIQQPEKATENPSTPVYRFCDPITGKVVLPELNVKNDQEAQKCYKHVLDLFDLSIYRLFEFKHIILARGYRGSDPLVDFCRAFMTAALKNIELAIPIAFALINHGCRFTPENKAIYQEMKIKYRTLLSTPPERIQQIGHVAVKMDDRLKKDDNSSSPTAEVPLVTTTMGERQKLAVKIGQWDMDAA